MGVMRSVLSEEETSGSSTGQLQHSDWAQKFSELVCALYCLFSLCDFCAAFFHVGVHASTDEGKIQSGAWTPQGNDIPAVRSRLR